MEQEQPNAHLAIKAYSDAINCAVDAAGESAYVTCSLRRSIADVLLKDNQVSLAQSHLEKVLESDAGVLKNDCGSNTAGECDFFDFADHTAVLRSMAKLDNDNHIATAQRYISEADHAKLQNRHLLALHYYHCCLESAEKIQKISDLKRKEAFLRKIKHNLADIHNSLGLKWTAWKIRKGIDPSMCAAPQITEQQKQLEILRLEFVSLLIDFHISLGKRSHYNVLNTMGSLTSKDENRTGSFFVSLLNLLDQVYGRWIRAMTRNAGDLIFPKFTSEMEMRIKFLNLSVWAASNTDTDCQIPVTPNLSKSFGKEGYLQNTTKGKKIKNGLKRQLQITTRTGVE